MTTSSPSPARRRPRTFADAAGAMLDAAAAAVADDDAASAPAPSSPATAATSPAAPAPAGPRVRASARSTLAGGMVRRTVYLEPDLWRAVLRLALERDTTAAAVVRQAVAEHVGRAGGGVGPR